MYRMCTIHTMCHTCTIHTVCRTRTIHTVCRTCTIHTVCRTCTIHTVYCICLLLIMILRLTLLHTIVTPYCMKSIHMCLHSHVVLQIHTNIHLHVVYMYTFPVSAVEAVATCSCATKLAMVVSFCYLLSNNIHWQQCCKFSFSTMYQDLSTLHVPNNTVYMHIIYKYT